MVGWGFAFGRGVVIFFWSIVWAIVAGIIAVVIAGGTLTSIVSNPTAFSSNPTAYLSTVFLGIFLSVFIAIIGFYASIVKITVDGTISQLEKSGRLDRPSSSPSYSLGTQPTQTAPLMQRKYCPNCGTSIVGGTTRCPNCAAML